MTSPARDYTLIRSRIETDPYNPVLVEDLINGLNDWRSVQDIVRLTFKALSDVVKSQGATIKELEVQLPGKASKSEISQCITMKNSYNEIARTLSDLKASIENKMNLDDVYSIVEEKVSRSDLQYLLGTKASYEELRGSLSEKADMREVQSEIRALRAIIEEMNEENYRKLQQCASKRDLQQLELVVETKAGKDEVTEALEEKANKQSVANALHRKSNKTDVEALLQSKVETNEFAKLFELVQEINLQISLKAEKAEVSKMFSQESSRKADRSEFESTVAVLQTSHKDSEAKLFSYISNIENFSATIKSKLEDFQSSFTQSLSKKSDIKDIDRLTQIISRKVDSDSVKDSLNSLQHELKEQIQSYRYEFHTTQDSTSEKLLKFEQGLKMIQGDLMQTHESIRNVSENTRVNLEEGVKSVHHYTGSKLEEMKVLRTEIERLYREIDEIKHRASDKTKIDARELKDFVEKHGRDLARQLQISTEDLKDLVLRKEKELTLMIDKKPGVHEITSLILESSAHRSHKTTAEDSYKDERSLKMSSLRNEGNYDVLQKDLSRIRLELDDRISSFVSDQNLLNEMLCSEHCVARWIWRSGEVRGALAIPWEVESVNTCPENYMWEVGSTSVVAVASGLYEITYAVFARKKPNVEVLVNGQPIFIEFHCAGKNWGRHADGNIVAASVVDFVTLPPRARISMTYSGEPGAEGFIGLRKL